MPRPPTEPLRVLSGREAFKLAAVALAGVVALAVLTSCTGAELEDAESIPCEPTGSSTCQASCDAFVACVTAGGPAASCAVACEPGGTPCETAAERTDRKARVAGRRGDGDREPIVMVHRVMTELGLETGLDGYRADLELGADGHDLDIRQTKDGVLVTFHDDFADQHLETIGAVEDLTYAELQALRLRRSELVGAGARVPSLAEVMVLHQREAGLIHADVKTAGTDAGVAALLDALDMWDHLIIANDYNSDRLTGDARFRRLAKPAIALYDGRKDEDPAAIQAALDAGYLNVFVDDPRLALRLVGRSQGAVMRPTPRAAPALPALPGEAALLAALAEPTGLDRVGTSLADAAPILARARAALAAEQAGQSSTALAAALADRVRRRSLHGDWRFHGVDGAAALRAAIRLGTPDAVGLAREVIWRDDPALEPLAFPGYARAVVDWRMKGAALVELAARPRPGTAALARDYLALGDAAAERLGFPVFEDAARALLAAEPGAAAARELLGHRRADVRGRAVMELMTLADQPWARDALTARSLPDGGSMADLAFEWVDADACGAR